MSRLVSLLAISLVLVLPPIAYSQKTVHVRTYVRKHGTVVQGHDRAAPVTNTPLTSVSTVPRRTSKSALPSIPRISTIRLPRISYRSLFPAPIRLSSDSLIRPRTITRDLEGNIHRSSSAKHDFMKMQRCPSTGAVNGGCPGYVIDHIKPLACGGSDSPSNMQWQTVEAAKDKDRWERKACQ
jgi:hypothetical protein